MTAVLWPATTTTTTTIITTTRRSGAAMLDDFFTRALVGGIGVALVAGPLGCFIVWRRMAYFGDTMAHAALLGVALALLLEIHITLGVFAITATVAFALVLLQRQHALPTDALLGILSHSTLALGLVMVAFMAWVRIDLLSYLFGDLLAVTRLDIALIYGGGAAVLAMLAAIWRPLLAGTVSEELAAAEGLRPERARLVFMLLMAGVIAIAMKIVGILLITSLLVIPAATARRFASGPEQMAFMAAAIGVAAVVLGLFGSLHFDTPSGPSVVVAALFLFLASLVALARQRSGAVEALSGSAQKGSAR
jgi:zinc transport system permease protein